MGHVQDSPGTDPVPSPEHLRAPGVPILQTPPTNAKASPQPWQRFAPPGFTGTHTQAYPAAWAGLSWLSCSWGSYSVSSSSASQMLWVVLSIPTSSLCLSLLLNGGAGHQLLLPNHRLLTGYFNMAWTETYTILINTEVSLGSWTGWSVPAI